MRLTLVSAGLCDIELYVVCLISPNCKDLGQLFELILDYGSELYLETHFLFRLAI
jgi:hypothetical protein